MNAPSFATMAARCAGDPPRRTGRRGFGLAESVVALSVGVLLLALLLGVLTSLQRRQADRDGVVLVAGERWPLAGGGKVMTDAVAWHAAFSDEAGRAVAVIVTEGAQGPAFDAVSLPMRLPVLPRTWSELVETAGAVAIGAGGDAGFTAALIEVAEEGAVLSAVAEVSGSTREGWICSRAVLRSSGRSVLSYAFAEIDHANARTHALQRTTFASAADGGATVAGPAVLVFPDPSGNLSGWSASGNQPLSGYVYALPSIP